MVRSTRVRLGARGCQARQGKVAKLHTLGTLAKGLPLATLPQLFGARSGHGSRVARCVCFGLRCATIKNNIDSWGWAFHPKATDYHLGAIATL